jgi:preprotein translocase subunit SecE
MATVAKAKQTPQGGVMGTINGVKEWPARFRSYTDGLKREMRMVTWPGREQVQATTAVVLVTVFIFAFYFGVVDYILTYGQTKLYDYFIGR